tara:strand:- start:258 stop:428 length:171 start_codon:yes stop_codon:yes gene_type:complete
MNKLVVKYSIEFVVVVLGIGLSFYVDDLCQADMNGDGSVSTADLLQFLTAFGGECD